MTISDALVGKTITSHELDDAGDSIRFLIRGGPPVVLSTSGDCCSTTWIESLDNPKALKGKVLSAKQIDMPDLGNIPTERRANVEEVKYYGLKIMTTKGTCVIDYRNDSNGYYGGSLEVV